MCQSDARWKIDLREVGYCKTSARLSLKKARKKKATLSPPECSNDSRLGTECSCNRVNSNASLARPVRHGSSVRYFG